MFSGIIEEVGRVTGVTPVKAEAAAQGSHSRVTVAAERTLVGVKPGDSIAVSGCCLTVTAATQGAFEVELSNETLAKTAPRWAEGARVNLERALLVTSRLGGHVVTGHVDGVGEVLERKVEPGAYVLRVRAPASLAAHLVPKGSISVDGVSLTLVDVGGPGGSKADWPATDFTLWLIPHTLELTTLGELEQGSKVNLESDILAKYAVRQQLLRAELAGTEPAAPATGRSEALRPEVQPEALRP